MGGGSVTTKVGTLVFVPTNVIILVMFVVIFVKNELLIKYEIPI